MKHIDLADICAIFGLAIGTAALWHKFGIDVAALTDGAILLVSSVLIQRGRA